VAPLPHQGKWRRAACIWLLSSLAVQPPVVGVSGRVGHRMAACNSSGGSRRGGACPSLGDASDVARWAKGWLIATVTVVEDHEEGESLV